MCCCYVHERTLNGFVNGFWRSAPADALRAFAIIYRMGARACAVRVIRFRSPKQRRRRVTALRAVAERFMNARAYARPNSIRPANAFEKRTYVCLLNQYRGDYHMLLDAGAGCKSDLKRVTHDQHASPTRLPLPNMCPIYFPSARGARERTAARERAL